jgi:hypothetical protein
LTSFPEIARDNIFCLSAVLVFSYFETAMEISETVFNKTEAVRIISIWVLIEGTSIRV